MTSRRKHVRLPGGDDECSTDVRELDTAGHRVQDELTQSSSPLSSSDAPTSSDAQMNPTTSRAGAGVANLQSIGGPVIVGNEDSHTMKDDDQDIRDVRDPHPAGHGQVGDTPKNPSEIQDTVARERTSSAQQVCVDSLQISGTNNPTFLGPVYKPTLNITQHLSVRESIPEPPLDDRTLREVAAMLGCDWIKLALELGYTMVQVQTIENNHRNDITRQGLNMLVTWKQDQSTSDEQQRTTLCTALRKIGRADVARFLHGVEDQATEDSTDQGNPPELAGQETENSTNQGNHPTGQRHYKWLFTAFPVVLIALVAILIVPYFRAVEEIPASSTVGLQNGETVHMPKVLSNLEYCQQQLRQFYKDTTSTIPSHPLRPSMTMDIDEVFVNLELNREVPGKIMPGESVKLSGEDMMLDKVQIVPLDTWEDFFEPEIVNESKIVLSGGAGFGKTTFLGKMANAWSAKGKLAKFKLVFLLKLRQMQKSSCIIDAIFDQILPKDTDLTKAKMKYIIANNQADIAFFLDGLDEIPSNVLESTEGVYTIKDILQNRVLVNSYVLVATRPHMVEYIQNIYTNFAKVNILGFTTENRNKFIKSHFTDNIRSGETLIARLDSIPSFHTLTAIPIISQMLCIIWKNQDSLPHNITALYSRFAVVLVKRRVADDRHWRRRMNTVLDGLGRIALNGLLNSTVKRLMFDLEEFSKCASSLNDGCEFGFLQRESFTSGLDIKEVVTFYHLSFQEYSAARYLIHLYKHDIDSFHHKLEQIDSHNLLEMEMLLRFSCGQSPEVARVILKHVQKLQNVNVNAWLRLLRLLLFESGSKELTGELNKQRNLQCNTREDLMSLVFYVQSVSITSLQNVGYEIRCLSYDDVKLTLDTLLNVKVSSSAKSFSILYVMSEQADREVQNFEEKLGSVAGKMILSRLTLIVCISRPLFFDFQIVSESMTRLSHYEYNRLDLFLSRLSRHDIIRIVSAFKECEFDRLQLVSINLHHHVSELIPLVTDSVHTFFCNGCDLDDDDVPDLIRCLQAGHGLQRFFISGNYVSKNGLQALKESSRKLARSQNVLISRGNIEDH